MAVSQTNGSLPSLNSLEILYGVRQWRVRTNDIATLLSSVDNFPFIAKQNCNFGMKILIKSSSHHHIKSDSDRNLLPCDGLGILQ